MAVGKRSLLYGGRLAPGSVGDRKVPANPTSKLAMPPIEAARFCRNGHSPDAQMLNMLSGATNANVLYRSKEVFRSLTQLQTTRSSSVGTTVRWRSAMHSGPHTHSLLAIAALLPPNSNHGNDTYGKLTVYSDATESTAAATAEFHYGVAPGTGASDGWQHLRVCMQYLTIDADTDYYLKWTDETHGRLQSACVIELPTMTGSLAGYLAQNISARTPIVDTYRESIATIQRALWRRGKAHTFNWFVDLGASPRTTTSATDRNVIDDTSTTVSAATPGYTIDMTGQNRLSQTTVPMVIKAFGHMGSAITDGTVKIKDSAGNTVTSLPAAWTGTTPTWVSGTFDMDPDQDKYDLTFSTSAGTFSLYAVSVWPQET